MGYPLWLFTIVLCISFIGTVYSADFIITESSGKRNHITGFKNFRAVLGAYYKNIFGDIETQNEIKSLELVANLEDPEFKELNQNVFNLKTEESKRYDELAIKHFGDFYQNKFAEHGIRLTFKN